MTFGFAFCSVLYGVTRVQFRFLDIFYFRVRFGSWQNLGSGSVRSCCVWVISHYSFTYYTSNYIDVMRGCDVNSASVLQTYRATVSLCKSKEWVKV